MTWGAKGPPDAGALATCRTLLFVPADRPDRFRKALNSGADVVIFDLEDGVAPASREGARQYLVRWLAQCEDVPSFRIAVRVNPLGSKDGEADLAALAPAPKLALMLSKAELPQELADLAARRRVPLLPLIETPLGLQRAAAIARAKGVVRLAFGHLDYAAALGALPTRHAMLQARSTLVQVSRAAGLPGPIDGVTTSFDSVETLESDISHARELGMTGKLLIHPRQVVPAQVAFRPSAEEVAWAEQVVKAGASGGAVQVGGAMVDAPVLAQAKAILERRRTSK